MALNIYNHEDRKYFTGSENVLQMIYRNGKFIHFPSRAAPIQHAPLHLQCEYQPEDRQYWIHKLHQTSRSLVKKDSGWNCQPRKGRDESVEAMAMTSPSGSVAAIRTCCRLK